ncbi:G-type lectin S-receptor-like serine/threonine-protein kinase LECRK3 [Cajanus cajan]|uniref:Receptor-like serine/threonine-protein kinase n=1 Tax=Cajanus cajan TaxID=3821 RepID=A0A151U7Z8_CAJCA|nr:G-type lectin S-receptor-like serine/threonine-protein kinase LECRK3 [Cajanus cajan]KYP75388.1 Putative receptor protein kinase ZmPK1 [Cajanus cajan]
MIVTILICATVILLPLVQVPYVSAQTRNNVSVGETLVAGNVGAQWLSSSKEIAFGFHQLENDLFLLAIWYQKIPNDNLIWYANGDNPAPKGSKLELNEYSGLMLNSPQGVELWTSQTISGTISYGLINDTGNFQLLDKNSQVLWESFSNPTDTLVPTQIMEVKGTLSSRQKETNFSQGRFRFRLLLSGNAVLNPVNLLTKYPYDAYYISYTYDKTNTTNSGYRVIFDNSGLYILKRNDKRVNITNSKDVLSTDSYYYRATINFDGVFTISRYPKNPGPNPGWTVIKTLPNNICTDLAGPKGSGVCGFNSICTLDTDQRPKCKCPEGYSLLDSTDEYGSCKTNLELRCEGSGQSSQGDFYYMEEMPNTDWPLSVYEMYRPYNSEDCKTSCLQDCLCAVSVYRNGSCWKKKLPLSNGRRDKSVGGSAFIKLMKNDTLSASPSKPFLEENKKGKDQDTLITVISVLLGGSVFVNLMLVSAVCIGFYFNNNRRSSINKTVAESNLRSFTFGELVQATNNFKEELGRGSCGIVFKGTTDLVTIAVKKLDKMLKDNDKEFKTEVNVIGQTHHKNLVRLLGYCDEGEHRILVYEFMSNGSLANFIFGDFKPKWYQRVQIAVGIARGLVYLHEECCTQIIHCDIKPQNILLDELYNARISDFGLSKLLRINQSRTETGIRGTRGYVAPEWFRSAPITAKVDVYSFGVLLVEIICCRRNVEGDIGNDEKAILTDWVYDCYKDGRVAVLVENDDEAINDINMLERFVKAAIWCLQEDPSLRPTMKKVMLMLEGIAPVTVPPSPCPYASVSVSCG